MIFEPFRVVSCSFTTAQVAARSWEGLPRHTSNDHVYFVHKTLGDAILPSSPKTVRPTLPRARHEQ